MISSFNFPDLGSDERYDSMTITLGEWHELGFYRPLEDPSWRFDAYDDAQYERLCSKILDRFYDREVSIITPYKWKRAYLRKLNEIMPKYRLLYDRIGAGANPLQSHREYSKSRSIYSEFPETLLSGNSDYASTGADRESDDIIEGNLIDEVTKFSSMWNDVDVMIMNELEHDLFTSIMVPTTPLW